MRNPFRNNRREEGASRAVAPARRGYDGPGYGAEGGGAYGRGEGEGPVRGGEGPVRGGEAATATGGRARGGPVAEREGERPVAERGRGEGEPGGRRTLGWRSRNAGAAAVGAVGGGVLLLARLVMTAAALIALLIALAIVLRDVDANSSNTIVKGIHEGANFFAGAFTGLIRFGGKPKLELTVDWGIAALVYLIVGAVIASAIRSVGLGGVRFQERHRPAL
jgi:hypothetical protein